jgi:hypothetical protein
MCPESTLAYTRKFDHSYLEQSSILPLRLYTIKEVALILRMAPETVRAVCRANGIQPIRHKIKNGRGQGFYNDQHLLAILDARCPLTETQRSEIAARLGIHSVPKEKREEYLREEKNHNQESR